MTGQPATCERPGCDRVALCGVGVLEAPPVWVCEVHLGEYLEGVTRVVEAVVDAARATS